MGRRTKRHLNPATLEDLLAAVGKCRAATIKVNTEAPISGPEYAMASRLLSALDDATEAMTGNRAHFLAAWHSTPGSPSPQSRRPENEADE